MKAVRNLATAFLLVVAIMAVFGWRWASDLPAPKRAGARTALVLTAAVSLAGITYIRTVKPTDSS